MSKKGIILTIVISVVLLAGIVTLAGLFGKNLVPNEELDLETPILVYDENGETETDPVSGKPLMYETDPAGNIVETYHVGHGFGDVYSAAQEAQDGDSQTKEEATPSAPIHDSGEEVTPSEEETLPSEKPDSGDVIGGVEIHPEPY